MPAACSNLGNQGVAAIVPHALVTGEVAVITNDVPMGTTPEKAAQHIKLLMLVNDVSLRNLIPAELAKKQADLARKSA